MIRIRPFQTSDASSLVAVFREAVTALSRRDYSEDQIAAWLKSLPDEDETRARCGDGRLTLVAASEPGEVVAFIELENDGHIDLLYAHPDVAGKGVALGLFAELEDHARSMGLSRLYVEASEPARRFFEKQGFRTTKRRDFVIHGVPIHNYAMEKDLAGGKV